MTMSTWLIVNLRVPAFHRWAEAPADHAYLSNWHRHEMHICCEVKVDKNRAFEFIQLKDTILTHLYNQLGSHNIAAQTITDEGLPYQYYNIILDPKVIEKASCEGLAEFIAKVIKEQVECSKVKVTVLEDGENGARVEV